MTAPVPEIYVPTNLYPTSAFLHGMCRSTGGLPTQFCFSYRNPFWWKATPWQNVDHDGQLFDVNVTGIGWALLPLSPGIQYNWECQVKAWVKNADGSVMTKPISFWLPKPTKPAEGAPWVIIRAGGSFSDMVYDWSAESDIGCLLHLLVGTRKPYISPTVHVTRGVVFHHDAELWFTWKWRIDSEQTIDTLLHDFHIPFFYYGKTYWFVAMGNVDGKNSPSISPPFSFRMLHPPKMETDHAYDITYHSAKLPGHLVDDYGMPAYVRFNYGIKPNYTDNTPTLGPEASPYDYVEEIDDLQPNTWYRFRAEGSHDEGFPTHGISYPKDFLTLPSPEPEPTDDKCETPTLNTGYCQEWNANATTFKPNHDYPLRRLAVRLNQWDVLRKGPVLIKLMTDNGPDQEGSVLWQTEVYSLNCPVPGSQDWMSFDIPSIPLVKDTSYRIVIHTIPPWYYWSTRYNRWVRGDVYAAMQWWRNHLSDEYPRGCGWYNWNFQTHVGPWKTMWADMNFICYE